MSSVLMSRWNKRIDQEKRAIRFSNVQQEYAMTCNANESHLCSQLSLGIVGVTNKNMKQVGHRQKELLTKAGATNAKITEWSKKVNENLKQLDQRSSSLTQK